MSAMPTVRTTRPVSPVVLAVGDGAVLVIWSILGLAHHAEGITLAGILRNAGPIALGWYAAALLLQTYARPGWVRFLATWALGISAGVLLRSLFLGRTWNADEFAFLGVTLAATLMLLSIWRGLAFVWTRRPVRAAASG
jgi:hypothetical protein